MQCLNVKNKEVAALLDQYTDILGSYDAAYYVLSENNGYGLDKAPNGEPSKLYNDLLSNYNNDHFMAIRAKSMVYSDNFKNWFGDWTNPLKPGDIVFGHPAIGKTYSLESGKYKDKIIDWDVEFNEKRDKWIEEHSNTVKGTPEYKKARNEYLIYPENHPDYVEFLTKEWERVKNKAKKEGKILFASPHTLLKMFPQDFNRIINLKDEDFIKRNVERGGKEKESKLWKEGINTTISNTTNIPIEYLNENQHFEDYLNKYIGISKVVDENGEPKLMFHGSDNIFDTFRNDVAIYTTDAISTADSYFYSDSNVSDRIELFEYNSEFESYSLEREGDYDRMEYLLNEYSSLDKPSSEYDNPYSSNLFFNNKFEYAPYKTADDFLHNTFPDFLDHIDDEAYRKKVINEYVEYEHPKNPNDFYKKRISGQILTLFVNNKNPLIIDGKGSNWNEIEYNGKIWSTRDLEIFAKNNNYDGLIINNIIDLGGRQSRVSMNYGSATVVVSYDPNQVKSINNQGTFSTTDNNIYNQQSNSQTGTGRNQELASILQKLYPNISIESLSDPNLRGQAQVNGYMAGKVLLNSLLENQDTLPHEYAHHYIAWFRNSNIVQRGIKLFGSEEQLVQAIGENSVKATKWYNRFFNWVKGLFNTKQKVLNELTNNFLSADNLDNGTNVFNEIHNQSIDKIDKYYNKIIQATKNRINLFTHSTNKIQQNIERLNNLYNTLNVLENDKAVIEFVGYMVDDINQSFNQIQNYINQFADYKNNGGVSNPITSDKLDIIKKGTIGFYNSLVVNLRNMLDDPNVIAEYKKQGVYDTLKPQLDNAVSKYNELVRTYNALADAIAKENIINEASKQSSFSVDELRNKLENGDEDISWWDKFVGQTQYSNSEVIRLMLNRMVEAKYKVHDKKLEVGKRLLNLLENVSKSDLKLLYERDKNGKRTGNLIRDLNYGQWEEDYRNYMLKVLDSFKLTIPSDMPFSDIPSILNQDQLKIWNKERNKWDNKHTERKFIPEFYDSFDILSQEAIAKKSKIDSNIKLIISKVTDKNGFIHLENLSIDEYNELKSLESARRNLSNTVNYDGTPKTGEELKIAKEFEEYNKRMSANLSYAINKEAFEKAKEKAKKTLSPDKYQLWLDRNTTVIIKEEFYEDLKKKASSYVKSDKQLRYEDYRRKLLKLYTLDGEVQQDSIPNNVRSIIRKLDIAISVEASKVKKSKSDIFEIAKFEIDPAFEIERKAAYSRGEGALFDKTNTYIDNRNRIVPTSMWKRLVPKDKTLYTERVPNSYWSEVDKNSPFINPKFDLNSSEIRQPKRSLYDNTKNYNKVKGNLKRLYDEILNVMTESNSKLPFITNSRNYRLPQIEGNAMTQILSQDNVLKGLGYAFKDTFTIKDDDLQYNVDKALDPDGSRIRLVPTRFMKKLENPEALTNDIVGSVIAYYGMAENYSQMSSIAPEMELITEFLSRQEFKDSKKGIVAGINSNTYAKAKQILEQFVYGMEENDMTIDKTIGGKRIKFSVSKAINNLARFTRLNGMGNNLSVILTGLFTNKIQSRLDAISGIYYDNEALNSASREIQSNYLTALANIGNANNRSKALCFLEWSGSVRSLEETFSKLNQSRWLRALNMHYWWGGYEAADFTTKGKMAIAIAKMYKLDPETNRFVHKNKFMLRYKDKEKAKLEWNRLTVTLYDAFTVKDNRIAIDDKYIDNVDEQMLNRVRNTIKQVGTRIDTQFTDLDKSFINSNAFCKLLFIYRNFLLINMETKFATKRNYDYSTGMWQEAQYRGAFNYLWRHLIDKKKIDTLKEMYRNYDELDDFERRLAKRVLYELAFSLVGLFVISSFARYEADEDEDDWFKNFMALISVRTAVESRSNLLPVETVSMFNSPTAAWGIIEHFGRALRTMFDDPGEEIKRGPYKGNTRFERSLIKITPFRSIYELKDPRSKLEYYDNLVSVF